MPSVNHVVGPGLPVLLAAIFFGVPIAFWIAYVRFFRQNSDGRERGEAVARTLRLVELLVLAIIALALLAILWTLVPLFALILFVPPGWWVARWIVGWRDRRHTRDDPDVEEGQWVNNRHDGWIAIGCAVGASVLVVIDQFG